MLNPKSLLKVLSVVLLSFGQVVGMVGVARSTIMAQQQDAAIPSIDDLIQVLKTGSEGERLEAGEILGQIGQTNPAVIPALLPLLKDPDLFTRWSVPYAFAQMGQSARSTIPYLRNTSITAGKER
jgi:HEAT repeat protein